VQYLCIQDHAGQGEEEVGEEGEEKEEGLEDIKEPSVMVTQVGRADSKQVSRNIILNHNIISYHNLSIFKSNQNYRRRSWIKRKQFVVI
jgi:transcriptional regulator of NAD metabolism